MQRVLYPLYLSNSRMNGVRVANQSASTIFRRLSKIDENFAWAPLEFVELRWSAGFAARQGPRGILPEERIVNVSVF